MHETRTGALRVAIVDDEPIARSRLRRILGQINTPPSTIEQEYGTADAILSQASGLSLDVVFIDIEMPGRSGLAALEHWRGPRPGFVFVTAHHQHALKAFDLQATDYLTKPVSEMRLQQTMTLLWGRRRGVQGAGLPAAALTDRQVQIVAHLEQGLANKDIARVLGLSHFTVRNHLMALYRIYRVSRRDDLVLAVRQEGKLGPTGEPARDCVEALADS